MKPTSEDAESKRDRRRVGAGIRLAGAAVLVTAGAAYAAATLPLAPAEPALEREGVSTTSPTPQEFYRDVVDYDGRFTFTRVRYPSNRSGRGFGRRGGFGSSAWAHDYPDGDRNLQTILDEFTAVRATTHGSNVVVLEDPEIFRYPILYVSEPGNWGISDEGAANLRQWLLKGGFLIFDDFEEDQWYNMAARLAEALPEGEWVEVDGSHPLFQSFFHVEDIYVPHPLVPVTPRYMVIFEDNDPAQRVMVLANHNADLAEYWEFAATGYFPVDPSNDAYKLGVNYIIYGLTH